MGLDCARNRVEYCEVSVAGMGIEMVLVDSRYIPCYTL